MTNARFVSSKEAASRLGVTRASLREWTRLEKIACVRTVGGHRRYDVDGFISSNSRDPRSLQSGRASGEEEKSVTQVCYCRVSSAGQRDDLERQVTFMRSKFPGHVVVTDIGSGINFKRKGLRRILDGARKGDISEVVVAHRDRLCRFAFELVEWILESYGVKVVVQNAAVDPSGRTDLAEDLLAIINVVNCRVNGRRKYKAAARKDEQAPQVLEACREQDQDRQASTVT